MLFDMRIRKGGEIAAELKGAAAETVIAKITEAMKDTKGGMAVFIYNSLKKDADTDEL